jgi:hypothetical protein
MAARELVGFVVNSRLARHGYEHITTGAKLARYERKQLTRFRQNIGLGYVARVSELEIPSR